MTAVLDLARYVPASSTSPPRKKQRTAVTTSTSTPAPAITYKPGNVVKLQLQNFVTYSLVEFQLSPSLNMIIGPNGSGKSTFVCALCLGLGGKPEFIGRSKRVGDFVKNGCSTGRIDVFLQDTTENLVKITRVIHRETGGTSSSSSHGNKAEYYIDDVRVNEAAVRKLVIGKFNIQLDNLCSFLSQERVEEFARLGADKLLRETLRAIDPKMLDTLGELKQLQRVELGISAEVTSNTKKLEELQTRREKVKVSVKQLQEFEKKRRVLETYSKLLPVAKIREHKESLVTYKRECESAKQALKELESRQRQFTNARGCLQSKLEKLQAAENETLRLYRGQSSRLGPKKERLLQLREDILKRTKQIEYYKNRSKRIQENIELTERQLATKTQELNLINVPESSAFEELVSKRKTYIQGEQQIKDAVSELDTRASAISHELNRLKQKVGAKLKSLDSTDRIGVLDTRPDFQELKKAVEYIRNKAATSDPQIADRVLEPPVMSISVTDPVYASYLMKAINMNTLKALTVVDSESYETYKDEILGNFRVNLRELITDENLLQKQEPPIPRDKLIAEYGFDGYLVDFIKGDERVIQMLCQTGKIYLIPVSKRKLSNSVLKELTELESNGGRLPFRVIFHGNEYINIGISSYDRSTYLRTEEVTRTQFFQSNAISDDVKQRIQQEIRELQEECKQRERELDEISSKKDEQLYEMNRLREESNALNRQLFSMNETRKKYTRMRQDCESLRERLETYKRDAKTDVTAKIKEIKKNIIELAQEQPKLILELADATQKISNLERQILERRIALFECQNLQISLNGVIGEFNNNVDSLVNEYEDKKRLYREKRDSEDYKEWRRTVVGYSDEVKTELATLKEELISEDHFTVKYIQEYIDKLESEIAITKQDRSAIRILEEVEREIAKLNGLLPEQTQTLNKTRASMEEKRIALEPRLDDIISRISDKFSSLFTRVGSAGAVKLVKLHLFDEWRIEIMVKFRDNAALKRLDSHTQSGGERAVSTVLYMIALQEFTTSPFRVVDEINQGMDQRNERIVHKAMVEVACSENTSQYFLITPKLLTGLFYHERMRVHCVMAGSWIPDPSLNREALRFGDLPRYVA